MHRYLAIVWNREDPRQSAKAAAMVDHIRNACPDLNCAFERDGLKVLHAGARRGESQTYLLADNAGVVLGTLFRQGMDSEGCAERGTLDGPTTQRLVSSGGRELLEKFWGRYVAFLHDAATETTYAIRDPSGQFRCYSCTCEGVQVFFSRMQDVVDANLIDTTVNWNFLIAQFLEIELTNGESGFAEVREVLSGECYQMHNGDQEHSFYWDPRKLLGESETESEEDLTELWKRTTQYCVGAWASVYPNIIHELSGGLDSAIVLACLGAASSRPHVTSLNYYTETPSGDERQYARTAAKLAGCELIELEMPSSIELARIEPGMEHTVKPDWTLFALPMHQAKSPLVEARGARAVTSGEGGDHIFYNAKPMTIAADYARLHGIDTRLIRIILQNARLSKKSFWTVLRATTVHGLLGKRDDARRHQRRELPAFLNREALAEISLDALSHPWEQEAESVPPAKLAQITSISKLLHRYATLSRCGNADVIRPLMSQPLMALALRTATFNLTEDCRATRALVRRAFHNDVPLAILQRKTKGLTTSYFTRMYVDNFEYFRELLMDGHLSRQAWLDRKKLEDFFTLASIENPGLVQTMLQLASTECWLRSHLHLRQRAAA